MVRWYGQLHVNCRPIHMAEINKLSKQRDRLIKPVSLIELDERKCGNSSAIAWNRDFRHSHVLVWMRFRQQQPCMWVNARVTYAGRLTKRKVRMIVGQKIHKINVLKPKRKIEKLYHKIRCGQKQSKQNVVLCHLCCMLAMVFLKCQT